MDPQPPPGPPGDTPPRARNGAGHYKLPGPLSNRSELPVAPSAPRIPRALRAFNGMPPEEPAAPPDPLPPSAAAPGRPREPLTIRDLLEDPTSEGQVDDGRLAGLRTALRKLRRGQGT